jgi:putative hydrolase of the HAD superfamily
VIVWDLGGVLARFRPGRRLEALADATGLPPEQIDHALWGSGLDAAAERGELPEAEVWSQALAGLDGRLTRSELRRHWAVAFEPDPEVLGLVDELGPGAILTNNGPLVEAALGEELATIGNLLDPWLLSWRLGATKPAPQAFERAAAALDRPPADLTLVDDRQENVDAARRAGWQAVLHVDATRTRNALAP